MQNESVVQPPGVEPPAGGSIVPELRSVMGRSLDQQRWLADLWWHVRWTASRRWRLEHESR